MKDFHSHILFGIDDGADTINDSMCLIRDSINKGVTDILLTPHYIYESKYNCNNDHKEIIFNEINKQINKEKLSINLYLGNEVFITDNILELIKNKEIKTLNNSKYILIEFPLSNTYNGSLDIIYDLVRNGYIPILAHPERYRVFQKHPEYMESFLRVGILLQGNYASLFGDYGRDAKKTLKFYLKKRWISFLGSDVHHKVRYNEKRIKRKLISLTKDTNYVNELLNDNFDKVINNQDIGIRNCSNR